MALNDKDKEYIKKTVDDAVNKSEKQNEQKMTNAIKANNKSNVLRSKKDRQETLEYLNKVGVLTLAEKIELMKNNISKEIKETVNEAIPEDLSKNLKQSFKNAGSNVGKGLGQGVDAVKSLLQGDILGGMGSALSGSINAGVGLAQGAIGAVGSVLSAGGAAASILSAKKDRDKRKKAKLQTEDGSYQELPAAEQMDPQENPVMKNASKMVEQKEKPIRKEPEEKTTTGMLKKGLGGLSKGLEMANGVLNVLATKQKLILASVGLGVVGILALVGWFKDGGMERLINGAVNKKLQEAAPGLNEQTKVQAEDNLDAQISQLKSNAEDLQTATNKNFDEGLYDKGGKEKAWKKHVLETTKSPGFAATLTSGVRGLAYKTKTVGDKKAGQTADIRVPVDCTVFEMGMEGYGDNATFFIRLIRKYEDKDKDRGWTCAPTIYIDNIIKLHVEVNKDIKANTKIATAKYPYNIYGDYDSFIKKEKDKSYQDTMFTEEAIQGLVDQYNETQDSAYKVAGGVDKHLEKELDTLAGNRKEADADYVKKRINGGARFEGMSNEKMLVKDSAPEQVSETPSVSVKETSSNTDKASQNNEKLKQQATAVKHEVDPLYAELQEMKKQGNQNLSVQMQSADNPDAPSTYLSPEQYVRASNNPLVMGQGR